MLGIILAIVLSVCSTSLSQTRCTDEQTCSAVCNEKKIDTSYIFKKLVVQESRGYDYAFSCTGAPCGVNNMSTAVCQGTPGSKSTQSCGAANSSVWFLVSTDPFLVLNISYSEGDVLNNRKRSSIIILTVDSNLKGEDYLFNREISGIYTFNFTVGSLSPPRRSHSVHEGFIGWILIALAVVGFMLYFIIGGLVMYYRRGARGVEIIPNVTFWKSFPFLVKDGFLFTISPCYKKFRRGYDKI